MKTLISKLIILGFAAITMSLVGCSRERPQYEYGEYQGAEASALTTIVKPDTANPISVKDSLRTGVAKTDTSIIL